VQTIKTAVVVVLLLVVLYGAYIAINGSETELPPELRNMLANTPEIDIDVSIPSFDSAGLTPSSGFKPGAPFGSGQGTQAASDLLAGPPPTFGAASQSSTSAPPKTLTPPKLTSIPSFPPMSDSPATLPGVPTSVGGPAGTPVEENSTKDTEPSFSLNVGGPSNQDSSEPKAVQPLSMAQNVPGNSKPLDAPSNLSVPGKLASQTTSEPASLTPSSEAIPTALASNESKESSAAQKANITGRSFENAKRAAIEQVDKGEFKEALAKMSVFYNSPELTAEQNLDLINLLDSLAGETIYSRRHLLDTPYIVGPGETIDEIAKRYEVPSELLAKINAVDTTIGLLPGTKIKVFRGPFRAEVDLNRHEMTVFLGDLYAGRFPVSTGSDPQPKEGVFQVLDKQRHRNYYGKGGIQIDGNDPRNPYGGWWMDLGQDLSIHGSPDNPAADNSSLGCISLSPLDASDVFSMLSRTSQVTIKR
jgi:lipoprotein-anchoring transpeptidase ErfK/SrfK